jgi:cyclopropane fatty-acyl-phospholipid synthase-like methyltransferase
MDLTERKTHFEFGENWRRYATTIDQQRIDSAIEGVRKLFPEGLSDKTFFDIGCGSGLHSLAALSLGASSVTAVDIDENSVATTRDLLAKYLGQSNWTVRVQSILDVSPEPTDKFDVVYSWGVLHHTGAMWRAIETAAGYVKPGGQFALAIYATTSLDPFWKLEKSAYSRSPAAVQWMLKNIYMGAVLSSCIVRGRNPMAYIANYSKVRGMNFTHDAHDWLGGYPYESATAEELNDRIEKLGFAKKRSFPIPATLGIFGSACHEFVFERLKN